MILIKNLAKEYKKGVRSIDGINLTIGKGEFIYFVGASGAGKSTLLNLIFRSELPTKGDIYIDNVCINQIPLKKIPYYRRNVGMIFQDYKLLPNRTVYENIAFALRVMHYSKSRIRRRVNQVLELVGLAQKANSFPTELSGGEQQRICIARAIVNNPPLLLADEPTGSFGS